MRHMKLQHNVLWADLVKITIDKFHSQSKFWLPRAIKQHSYNPLV